MNPRRFRPPLLSAAFRSLGLAAALWLALRSGAQTNDLSLADSFPPDVLRSILLPPAEFHPYPTFRDRTGWEGMESSVRAALVKLGQEAVAKPLPALPASLYLAYARDGNRSRYEGPYFDRRRRLHRLVLAECVEAKARFRDAIADTLWAICEESTWCVPAHVGGQKAGVGLPDIEEPIVDLFAAQTGASVAWTLYLYAAELDAVSPRIRKRAESEVQRRILASYLNRDYGWMGFGSKSPANRPNNWNPWINGNVLTAALLLERDDARRIQIVHRALRSLDRFLQPYPSDGGCDEGPGYWSRAGASVLDNLDLLHDATRGRLDVFKHPLIGEMGRFIHRVHIADDWFVALGDCSARSGIDRGAAFRYGGRIGDADLQDLATQGATLDELVDESGSTDLGRGLRVLSDLPRILAAASRKPPLVRDAWMGSDDMQMMIARDQAGTTRGFFVAAWGAHNAQSHNHNDVGNFVLFADGQPVLVDLGAPTYTAKTFSRQRYDIPAMQSAFHNLPTVHGVFQSAGRDFAARDVHYRSDEAFAELAMDIAPAWPESAKVRSWQRTVRLQRGAEVRLTESFQLDGDASNTHLNLITPRTAEISMPGKVRLPLASAAPAPRTGRAVVLHFDANRLAASVEPLPLDDGRLAGIWGKSMTRIRIQARNPAPRDTWDIRFTIEVP